ARMATATTPQRMTALSAPSGFRRTSVTNRVHAVRRVPADAAVATTRVPASTRSRESAVADPGIEPGIAHVDEEVDEHDDGGEEEHGSLDDGVVPELHGIEQQASHAGMYNAVLHDHRAPEQHRELLPDHGHHGDERVLEGVPQDHRALALPLGPGRADVVL